MTKEDLVDRVNVVPLDVQRDLVQQVREMDPKPDVIVSKLHKALGSTDAKSQQCIENFKTLQESEYGEMLETRNMIPLLCEMKLVDRYSMVVLLKRVAAVVRKIGGERCDLGVPEWVCCHKDEPAPPCNFFPVVVKSKSTAVKQMGVVFNKDGLARFIDSSQSEEFTLEQYIPHSGVVYKIYVVGKHTYVGSRPSLPDLTSCAESLRRVSAEIKGEATTYTTDESCNVYLTFYSNLITNRAGKIPALTLYDHTENVNSDLEYITVKLMQEAIQSEWGIDLFGFDVLVDKATKRHYVIDVNVLPGYKGVGKFSYHSNKLFLEYGERFALAADIQHLRADATLTDYCKAHLPGWHSVEGTTIESGDANTVKISPTGVEGLRPALGTFFDTQYPVRGIHDEKNFLLNVTKALSVAELTPPLLHTVTAPYHGCTRYLGHFVACPPASRSISELLSHHAPDSPVVLNAFTLLGKQLRCYHGAMDNEGFRSGIVDHHFGLLEGQPLYVPLLENWRRKVLLKTEKFKDLSEQWSALCNAVFESRDTDTVKKTVLQKLQSRISTKMVFGYMDVNFDSILLHGTEAGGDEGAYLLSTSFCGPNFAVHDFSNLYICLVRAVGETAATTLLRTTAASYLNGLTGSLDNFLADCTAFIPLASLLNVYKHLLYATRCAKQASTDLECALEEYNLFKRYY